MAPHAMNKMRTVMFLLVGGVFLFAGVSKALDPAAFALAIYHYKVLPWKSSAVLALYLPYLEIVSAGGLLFRSTRQAALVVILLMTVLFTAALISAAVRGLDISCGCFGTATTNLSAAIFKNCLLTVATLALLRKQIDRS